MSEKYNWTPILTCIIFLTISCNKDNDEELIEEKQYEFSSIMWLCRKVTEKIFLK